MNVCVVTATFEERAAIFKRHLDSICQQTWQDNLSVVVVDDTSTTRAIKDIVGWRRAANAALYTDPVQIEYVPVNFEDLDIGRIYTIGCRSIPENTDVVVVTHGEILLPSNCLSEFVRILTTYFKDSAVQCIPTHRNSNCSIEKKLTHYDRFRRTLKTLEGSNVNLSWDELAIYPNDLVVDMEPWTVCFAFWVGDVWDICNAFVSVGNGRWSHEKFCGFKRKTRLIYPPQLKIIHQDHFSEPQAIDKGLAKTKKEARQLGKEAAQNDSVRELSP